MPPIEIPDDPTARTVVLDAPNWPASGDELLGRHENWAPNGIPVRLATWGANPIQKDIFYEADWLICNSSDTNNCPQGPDSGKMGAGIVADSDFYTNVVAPLNADMTGLQVHLDVGRTNTNPTYWLYWGDWGGAQQIAADRNECGVDGASLERNNLFHHFVSYPPEDTSPPGQPLGNTCWGPGPFFRAMVNYWRIDSHESGHGLGLGHGGRPNKGLVNYKPNYVSIMNYSYQWVAPGFSHGDFPAAGNILNPTVVKENPGLGSGAASINLRDGTTPLQKLRDAWCPVTAYSSGTCVNLSTGAVDWNRDGSFAAQNATVQGAVAMNGFAQDAETVFWPVAGDGNGNPGHGLLNDPALTWVSVGGSVGNQLWIFGRDESNQLVWARDGATTLNAGCGGPFSSFNEGMADCAGMGDGLLNGKPGFTTLVSGPKVLAFAPGAAEYNAQILVVFQPTTGTIASKLLTINSATGNVTYGGAVTLPGGRTAIGDITALKTATGQVSAWAPVNVSNQRKLIEWRYANGAWSGGQTADIQKWTEDGSDIAPTYGIGATRGYQDNSTTQQTYGAIAINPWALVEFARKNAGTNTWTRVTFTCAAGSFGCVSGVASSWAGTGGKGLPTDNPPGTQPRAKQRPGLAYQKRAGQPNNYVGRFYMAINQQSSCSQPFGTPDPSNSNGCEARLVMTEGNLAANTPTSQRFTWITPAQWLDSPYGAGGIALVDDITRDANLRAAFGNSSSHSVFAPLADGIVSANLSDLDDRPYITGALRASLCLDGGSWPQWNSSFGANLCPLPSNLQ